MVKMICFDMDGTIADLYGVKNWLEKLRTFDPTPYIDAKPLCNIEILSMLLNRLNCEVNIITWLSKDSTKEYDEMVRIAKKEWLADMGLRYDHFYGRKFGSTKADAVRARLKEGEEAILFDDNAKVRAGWKLGRAIDPTKVNIIDFIASLLEENA